MGLNWNKNCGLIYSPQLLNEPLHTDEPFTAAAALLN